jgi:tetratricopeptide (TPR) repeat protein
MPENRSNTTAPLEDARKLFEQGRLRESEAVYRGLIEAGQDKAEAFYGLGLIRWRAGDLGFAAAFFDQCTNVDHSHQNAYYYLGRIWEARKELDIAKSFYRKTLTINPKHGGALQNSAGQAPARQTSAVRHQGLAMLSAPGGVPAVQRQLPAPPDLAARAPAQTPAPVPAKPGRASSKNEEFYELIRRDPSHIAQLVLQLIDRLRLKRRPHLSAYLGRFLLIFSLALPVAALTGGRSLVTASLVCMLYCFYLKTTRYTISSGRLLVSTGVFAKRIKNVELYRVLDLELHRSFLNRITRDGTIILTVAETKGHEMSIKLPLKGIARGRRLSDLFQGLRNLVDLLRTGYWGKGIIK